MSRTVRIIDREVARIGLGTLGVTGPGGWGLADRAKGADVLQTAVEAGVQLIDTADSYGPHVVEELIRDTLAPYPRDLLVATKAGLLRFGPDDGAIWREHGHPDYLRQQCMLSRRRLGVERIDLLQLHRVDPRVPAEEQFGVLRDLFDEGVIGAVGLSEVTVAEIELAQSIVPIATVQNMYSVVERGSEAVLRHCERAGIVFMPWYPLRRALKDERVVEVAQALNASTAQVALAWLLAHSPAIAPVPGASSAAQIVDNMGALELGLAPSQLAVLDALAEPGDENWVNPLRSDHPSWR